ncbi:MAG: universal stress protein [Boseongicola sp.]|nr:universal stress protein [Boseongicola sp.]
MENQTLLLLMSDQTPDDEVRAFAQMAATRNARLICLVITLAPTYPVSAFGALPYAAPEVSSEWVNELTASRKRMKERGDALEAILQAENASGDVQVIQCNPIDIRTLVARRAMVCDMVFLSDSMRSSDVDIFHSACYGVLFNSPAPLLLNAQAMTPPNRVFIAWDTELPASRAAHAALPLLKTAEDIFIGVFDPEATETQNGEDPGADLAKWLSHHGCNVTINQYPSGGADIATNIQRRAQELGADLVVMGAFGRSRLRELVLGGTTRSMLHQTDVPVLMAH